MTVFSNGTFPQLTDLVNRDFVLTHENYPYEMKNGPLVKMRPQMKNTGLVTRFAEMIDVAQYASQSNFGAQIPSVLAQYGYEKDLFQTQVDNRLEITLALREGAKNYEQTVGDMIKQFSETVPNRQELDLAHRLTFAYLTSYVNKDGFTVDTTCGDGLALASSAHTLTGSGTTYSTIITGNPQASKGAIEVALKGGRENSYDNFGVKVNIPFNIIWTTNDPNTMDAVDELLHATADVTSSNAGTFNVFGSAGQYKLRRFTASRINTTVTGGVDTAKSKMWGIASEQFASIYFSELTAPRVTSPQAGNNGEDINTLNWIWTAVTLYGIAVPAARWIRISSGTGADLTT